MFIGKHKTTILFGLIVGLSEMYAVIWHSLRDFTIY